MLNELRTWFLWFHTYDMVQPIDHTIPFADTFDLTSYHYG